MFTKDFLYPCTQYRKLEKLMPRGQVFESVSCMSYNILADSLVARDLYSRHNQYLDFEFRQEMIFANEVDPLSPDILCLQEQQDCDTGLLKKLVERNYMVLVRDQYYSKCRLPPRVDGLLTAFKMSKFSLLKKYELEFFLPDHPILNKQNVALFLLLESRETGVCYLVVNCHLLFNKNRGDIKYCQAALIMRTANLILGEQRSLSSAADKQVFVLWGGDFNTTPCSPLYNFLRTGSTEDLALFAANCWTGQAAAGHAHYRLQSSQQRKLEILGERFDREKHGKYLHRAESREAFLELQVELDRLELRLEGEKVRVGLCATPTNNAVLYMKSAYGELWDAHGRGSGQSGEMSYSTIPVQDPYPHTVDYLL